MESAVGFGILNKAVALLVELTASIHVCICAFGKIVLINEVVSRVIGRIDIDHLDLAHIGFLQKLEHIEVIALDIEVFRGIKIHALLAAGAQRCGDRAVCKQYGLFLIRPCELIALLLALNDNRG